MQLLLQIPNTKEQTQTIQQIHKYKIQIYIYISKTNQIIPKYTPYKNNTQTTIKKTK